MNATELLAQVKVASACPARWEDMSGDERSRFCLQCNKHVYNFSAMSASAAAELVRAKEWKLCARFHRRADGTMLTADCPVGLERYGRRLKALCSTAAGLLLSSLGVSAWSNFVLREDDQPRAVSFKFAMMLPGESKAGLALSNRYTRWEWLSPRVRRRPPPKTEMPREQCLQTTAESNASLALLGEF